MGVQGRDRLSLHDETVQGTQERLKHMEEGLGHYGAECVDIGSFWAGGLGCWGESWRGGVRVARVFALSGVQARSRYKPTAYRGGRWQQCLRGPDIVPACKNRMTRTQMAHSPRAPADGALVGSPGRVVRVGPSFGPG